MGRGPGELDASVRHQLKTHLSAPKQMWNLREKLIRDSAARKKTLLTLAWIVIWSFFLWRALSVFGPSGTANDVTFNSDCAIPVLMSNDERPLTAFNLYYYGADRWGGWPFLVTQLV